MQRKRRMVRVGFSNEQYLELLSSLTGISPVGELGRETPLDFSSLEAARGSLLIREMFSKFDDGKPSEAKERTTWERFHEAESLCREANERIPSLFPSSPFWVNVRRRMWDALGPFSWDACARHFAFGPGATTRLTRAQSAAAYKYSGIPESTSGCAGLASCAIRMIPLWNQSVLSAGGTPDNLVKVVMGNSVLAVPKNYKTDRTIAKEPCMNIYIQKGIGRLLRHRLLRVGVDLNDQTRNQELALLGSLTGLLATVDMSMASDTVAYNLVSWLLPNDWWYALEQSRSQFGVLPSGEMIRYQKFSSMGNGYTFELESLIFWAIAQECACPNNIVETDESVSVYGDDVIVPTWCYEPFVQRLQEAGFVPNPKKTYAVGPYRESCGKHFYLGTDITPFYVRKPVESLDKLFLCHNNLWRWEQRTGVDCSSLRKKIRALAPASWREPRLPDGYGDGAFIGDVDELRLDSHPHGWEYWQVKALVRCQTELSDDLPFGQLMASLKEAAGRRSLLQWTPRIWASASRKRTESGDVGADLDGHHVSEAMSGLPAMVGGYQVRNILIPMRPQRA